MFYIYVLYKCDEGYNLEDLVVASEPSFIGGPVHTKGADVHPPRRIIGTRPFSGGGGGGGRDTGSGGGGGGDGRGITTIANTEPETFVLLVVSFQEHPNVLTKVISLKMGGC